MNSIITEDPELLPEFAESLKFLGEKKVIVFSKTLNKEDFLCFKEKGISYLVERDFHVSKNLQEDSHAIQRGVKFFINPLNRTIDYPAMKLIKKKGVFLVFSFEEILRNERSLANFPLMFNLVHKVRPRFFFSSCATKPEFLRSQVDIARFFSLFFTKMQAHKFRDYSKVRDSIF